MQKKEITKLPSRKPITEKDVRDFYKALKKHSFSSAYTKKEVYSPSNTLTINVKQTTNTGA